MKKILITFGALFLALIVGGIAFISYLAFQGFKLNKSSKKYVDENVPKIVSNWSAQELLDRASPELLQVVTPVQIAQLFPKLGILGPLTEYQGAQGQAGVFYNPKDGKVISASYVANASFAKGSAEINIRLIQHQGSWQILSFRVNSPVFLK